MTIEDYRKLGEARLAVAGQAKSKEDWQRLWQPTKHDFPFKWGDCWKHCIEYVVDDFAAEVGFFIDVLGFSLNAFSRDYVMFTGPDKDFFFAFVPSGKHMATPKDAIRIEFMVDDIMQLAKELESRGIAFEDAPKPYKPGSPMVTGSFRTPNGISVVLWGMVQSDEQPDA